MGRRVVGAMLMRRSAEPASRAAAAPRRITTWLLSWGDRRSAPVILVLLTILEATIFPAPTEAMLLAMCISRPKRAWTFGLLAAMGSLCGGIAGYFLGATLYPEFGQPLLSTLGLERYVGAVSDAYRENLWLALSSSGYTPIPYMVYTMLGGAFALPVHSFAMASFVGRALKYLPIAILTVFFGAAVHRVLERHAAWAGLAVALLLLGAVILRIV